MTQVEVVDKLRRLPDPGDVPGEDAIETLRVLISQANDATDDPAEHPDQTFVCSVCGVVVGKKPVFQDGRAFCKIHQKTIQPVGPLLGRVESAERPK